MGINLSWTRRNKYNRSHKSRRTIDGIVFDSIAEMQRYLELKVLERAGQISNIELQPRFELIPKTKRGGQAIVYIADFGYTEKGERVYEDVKGVLTPVYKIKKKLLLWKYPEIDFREIQA